MKQPNEVDQAHAQALLADPWIAPSSVSLTSFQNGTNDLFSPTEAGADHRIQGAPGDAVMAEVSAARTAGWSPFYGQCPDAGPGDVSRSTEGHLMVMLARELGDGAVAHASVFVDDEDIYVLASVPNHAAPPVALPAEVDLRELACLAPDGTGVLTLGEAVDIAEAS